MTDDEILTLEMNSDIGRVTIRFWLSQLLSTLWDESDCFSGKRPFGNSGWQWDAYKPLVESGAVNGTLDSDGCLDDVDRLAANAIMNRLIDHMCGATAEVASRERMLEQIEKSAKNGVR